MPINTNFIYRDKTIILHNDIKQNQLSINKVDYYASPLSSLFKRNKGAHSFVFALYPCQEYDNYEESTPRKVIKISNIPDPFINDKIVPADKNARFRIEIEALTECKRHNIDNIIEINFNDYIICTTTRETKKGKRDIKLFFPFYMMDFADADLKQYLENNELDKEGKIELCLQLAEGLNDLNNLGYYHRDIKPDNILFFNDGNWRIGDLGLVARRDLDYDGQNELIEPKGWLSPESMNKYLAKGRTNKFDCNIDHQSDIFQLGKVFWYILQGNAPIGCIERADFLDKNDRLYTLIHRMISHSKQNRISTMADVIQELKQII